MSIWNTILGGAAGFMVGGPIGGLMGAAAVHFAGKASSGVVNSQKQEAIFAAGFIALCAKMAKADGIVTREEINVFKKSFRVPPNDAKRVAWLFDQAKKEMDGYEGYANQLYSNFYNQPAVLEQIVDLLFHIAMADGIMHPAEMDYLNEVAQIFMISESDFSRISESHMVAGKSDPYTILGVSYDATDKQVKSAYRKLIKEHHPDLLMAQGVPEELIEVATNKMAIVNNSYDKICKARGIK